VTAFLHRLADMALGNPAPGAARVSLPPTFAPPAVADMSHRLDTAPEDDRARVPAAQPPAASQFSTSRNERATVLRGSDSLARAANDEVPHWTSVRALPRSGSPSGMQAPPTPMKQDARVKLPSPGMMSAPEVVRASARDASPAPGRAPTAASADHPAPRGTDAQPILRSLPAEIARAAPLSDAAVASRGNPRDDRPAINVTIDRIDVRSPATAKSGPTPRRARPEPTVSLSEYLRRNAPGGRA
jgi:hypothetical protein